MAADRGISFDKDLKPKAAVPHEFGLPCTTFCRLSSNTESFGASELHAPGAVAIYALGTNHRMAQNVIAATTPDAGIVNTQAHTICLATPQRTAERREVEPTPTIAPVIVCVVLTGMPW